MGTNSIKIAVAANIIFLSISIFFMSNAYLGEVDALFVSADKVKKIEEIIKNETEVEKIKSIALVSLVAQSGAYETVDAAIEVSSTAIKLFSTMFAFNILFLLAFLYKNKKKSNNNFKRTTDTEALPE